MGGRVYDWQDRLMTAGLSLPSIVYECNGRCGCNHEDCANRVLGRKPQVPLQLFRTDEGGMEGDSEEAEGVGPPVKGWGVRCVAAVPEGTLVCIFAGQVRPTLTRT